MVIKYNYK